MNISVNQIRTNFDGFCEIINIDYTLSNSSETEYVIDMSQLQWIDANMCAPLGAILYKYISSGRNIKLISPESNPKALDILQKNAFLQSFGVADKKDDFYKTTIQYEQFNGTDNIEFQSYINSHFNPGSKGLPQMSEILLKEFRRSLYEIYLNALEHSETKLGTFACGQYFPKNERLDFTIADLGIGIRERIRSSLNYDFTSIEAIEWATSGKTTKMERKTGGLGFSLIKDFIKLNQGRIIIVSDRGFWEFKQGKITINKFTHPFPGTVVTIEVNTADPHSYCFENEIDATQIF